jgi:hypothetical protein
MAKKAEAAPDKEVLLAEYHELAEGMRFHSDVRWKLLSVVIPVAGGLLAVSIQFPNLRLPMNIFGLLTSSVFALIEYRTQLMWHVLFNRATEVETALGIRGAFQNMKPLKKPWYWIDSTKGIRLAYFVLIAYWILALFGIL